jgi:hypothetical protein
VWSAEKDCQVLYTCVPSIFTDWVFSPLTVQ